MVQLRTPHNSGDNGNNKDSRDTKPEQIYLLTGDSPELSNGHAVNLQVNDEMNVEEGTRSEDRDSWDLPELKDETVKWTELTAAGRVWRVLGCWIGKPLLLLLLIYLFICSLSLLSSAFRLLGGKKIGEVFSSSELVQNPVSGLMIGLLATVAVQSSSMSTSIVITMVAADILTVPLAIPIIMGANIGTSVTNTLVAMGESGDRSMFRLAFAGATVHDMFNWLAVMVLLPLECATGYLYHLTTALVSLGQWETNKSAKRDFFKLLTKPFTSRIVRLDKKVIEKIALGHHEYAHASLIKRCIKDESTSDNTTVTDDLYNNTSATLDTMDHAWDWNNDTSTNYSSIIVTQRHKPCTWSLLSSLPLSDTWLGLLLLAGSLLLLCCCLLALVRLLRSMLHASAVKAVRKVVNKDFIGSGYLAMLVGFILTVLIQSSSILLSILTPLVGMGVIRVEKMYPVTLGANIGGTATGLMAALAVDGDKLQSALQVALVHLTFNISGIILFYPVPHTRLPIKMAKIAGNTTAKYRWFPVLYLLLMFVLLPLFVFALSLAGTGVLAAVLTTAALVAIFVTTVNIMQTRCPSRLPAKLQSWSWLPLCLHSLKPLDSIISSICSICSCCASKSHQSSGRNGENDDSSSCSNQDSRNQVNS